MNMERICVVNYMNRIKMNLLRQLLCSIWFVLGEGVGHWS